MTKHTPGPWDTKATAGGHQHLIWDESGKTVALVYTDATDAAVIAAVPDMLAALEAISGALYSTTMDAHTKAALAKVNAAIAKGRGRATDTPTEHARKPTLVIVMDGGIIQSICSDDPAEAVASIDGVLVIDYDTEGADPAEVVPVRQYTGEMLEHADEFADAFVSSRGIDQLAIDLPHLNAALEKHAAESETV